MQIGASSTLVEIREGWDDSIGRFYEYVYEGSGAAILSIARAVEPIAQQTLITNNGKKYTLIVRFDRDPETGSFEQPRVDFRLVTSEQFKDILESDYAASLTDNEVRIIREAIQSPQDGVSPALQTAAAIDIYTLMLKGVRSIPVFQNTLVMLRTAPSAYNWVGRPTNVGYIYSEAQMLAELNSLSGGTPSFSSALPQLTSSRSDAAYGWRKKMPSYDQVGGGHTSETTEYEYGLWSTDIYTSVT